MEYVPLVPMIYVVAAIVVLTWYGVHDRMKLGTT